MSITESHRADPRLAGTRVDTRLTLREILTPVFYHKRLALLAFIVPVVLAFAAALHAPVTQIADSKLLILLGKDYVLQDSAVAGALSFDRSQIVQAEMEILGARDVHEATIQKIGINRLYPDLAGKPKALQSAILRFDKDLALQNVPESNVIDLQFKSKDAQVAIDVLNTLDAIYLQRRSEVFQQFSQAQIQGSQSDIKTRLTQLDDQIAQISQQHQIGDYTQALAAAQTDQAAMATHLHALDEQLASSEARTSRLTGKLSSVPSSKPLFTDRARSQVIQELTTRLLDLQSQRREAAAKYADGYPLIVDLDQRIATVQQQINKAPADQVAGERIGTNPTYEALDSQVATAQGDIAGLSRARAVAAEDLNRANRRLAELTALGPTLRELTRSRDVLESTYGSVARRAEDNRVSESLSGRANVRVIQPAGLPTEKKTLKMPLLAAGLAAGLVAAIGSVVLASNFRQAVITPREAEQRLGYPVLAVVPGPRGGAVPSKGSVPSLADGTLTLEDCLLLLRLAVARSGDDPPIIQFVASQSGVGVSSIALDFASLLSANTEEKILLMDIDPPEGEAMISRMTAKGVKFLPAEGRHVRTVKDTRLVISEPAGARDMVVTDDKWENVLGRARRSYGAVILDTPPPSRSSANFVTAPFADLIVVVVEAEKSRASADAQLIQRLEATGGEVAGLILNKRRFHIPKLLYAMS